MSACDKIGNFISFHYIINKQKNETIITKTSRCAVYFEKECFIRSYEVKIHMRIVKELYSDRRYDLFWNYFIQHSIKWKTFYKILAPLTSFKLDIEMMNIDNISTFKIKISKIDFLFLLFIFFVFVQVQFSSMAYGQVSSPMFRCFRCVTGY